MSVVSKLRIAYASASGVVSRTFRRLDPRLLGHPLNRWTRKVASRRRQRRADLLADVLRVEFTQPPRELTQREAESSAFFGLGPTRIDPTDPAAKPWYLAYSRMTKGQHPKSGGDGCSAKRPWPAPTGGDAPARKKYGGSNSVAPSNTVYVTSSYDGHAIDVERDTTPTEAEQLLSALNGHGPELAARRPVAVAVDSLTDAEIEAIMDRLDESKRKALLEAVAAFSDLADEMVRGPAQATPGHTAKA